MRRIVKKINENLFSIEAILEKFELGVTVKFNVEFESVKKFLILDKFENLDF